MFWIVLLLLHIRNVFVQLRFTFHCIICSTLAFIKVWICELRRPHIQVHLLPLIEGRVSPLKILTLLSMQCLTTWALSPRLPSMHCGSINCPAWCSKVTIPLGDPPPPTPSARGSSGGFNSYELKDHKLIKVIEEFSPFKIVYKPLGGNARSPASRT